MYHLIDHIIGYVNFLHDHLHLEISLHDIPGVTPGICPGKLVQLNLHSIPFCLCMKMNEGLFHDCYASQKELYERLKTETRIFNMCHAGVCEFIYAVLYQDTPHGYVSITGYRPREGSSLWEDALEKIRGNAERYGLDADSTIRTYQAQLSPELPEESMLDAVIHPLCDLLSQVCREQERLRPIAAAHDSRTEEKLFSSLCYVIWNSHNQKITLADLAARFNYSESYISHIFKSNSGLTINQYVNTLRIAEAKTLLTTTKVPIQEISQAVGFSDSNYFSNVFHALTGISPRTYRNQHKEVSFALARSAFGKETESGSV